MSRLHTPTHTIWSRQRSKALQRAQSCPLGSLALPSNGPCRRSRSAGHEPAAHESQGLSSDGCPCKTDKMDFAMTYRRCIARPRCRSACGCHCAARAAYYPVWRVAKVLMAIYSDETMTRRAHTKTSWSSRHAQRAERKILLGSHFTDS